MLEDGANEREHEPPARLGIIPHNIKQLLAQPLNRSLH